MRGSILLLLVFSIAGALGAVVHVPIQSNRELDPGAAYTVALDAAGPLEIGWLATQARQCTTKCVQATDLSGGIPTSIATSLGATMHYKPVAGRISVEYKNVSNEPVTINVFRVDRTCDAEACEFLDDTQKGRWLVFKVDEFKTIATSKDGSYSVISGVTVAGKPFSIKAVWWTDDKNALLINCSPFVQRYLNNHAPKEQYSPYIISGHALGEGSNIVLKSIDTCAPKAPKFGVPDENVFH